MFEVHEEKIPYIVQEFFVDKITSEIPEEEKEGVKQHLESLIRNYEGRDSDAISVLMYAVEHSRLNEFIEKLEKHLKDSLQFVHPDARRLECIPGALRAEAFFIECYKSMGIKPS